MTPRERVIRTIKRQPVDRPPLYAWVSWTLGPALIKKYGSVEAFEDLYEFDLAHLFGMTGPFTDDVMTRIHQGEKLTPEEALAMPLTDPHAAFHYERLKQQVRHYGQERQRFTYVQSPGLFECLNTVFGIENHLMYLATEPETLLKVYQRQAEWNRAYALHCLECGIDMIHISDDWGAQKSLMFRPSVWRELIYPHHKGTIDVIKKAGGFVSLHSDGNINSIVPGLVELGFDVVHPWQESAGMSLEDYRDHWQKHFTVMGGLDVQSTLGFGRKDSLESEIRRITGLFPGGGLIYCTTHFVSEYCTVEELTFALDLIRELTGAVSC